MSPYKKTQKEKGRVVTAIPSSDEKANEQGQKSLHIFPCDEEKLKHDCSYLPKPPSGKYMLKADSKNGNKKVICSERMYFFFWYLYVYIYLLLL